MDADYLEIVRVLGNHLQSLHVRGAAVRVKAGDANIGARAKRIQRGRPGIAAGRGQNQVLLAALLCQRRQD